MRGTIMLLAIVTAASGCAVQGPAFEKVSPPPEHAVIYVYRPYSYFSSLLVPPVTCGEETARIGPGAYHAFVVPTGKVTCYVPGGETADEVETRAEPHAYYVKEDFENGLSTGHPHLNPIDTDKAQTEIQSCVQEAPEPSSTPSP